PSTRELVLPCRTRTVHATSSAPTYEFACRAVATRRSGRDAQNGGPPTPPVSRPASHSEPNSYTRTHLVWCTLRVRHRDTSWRRRCGRGGPEGVGGRDRARPPPDAPAWWSPAAGGCGRRLRRAAGGVRPGARHRHSRPALHQSANSYTRTHLVRCTLRVRRCDTSSRIRRRAQAANGTHSPLPVGRRPARQLVLPNPARTVHATSSAPGYEFAARTGRSGARLAHGGPARPPATRGQPRPQPLYRSPSTSSRVMRST